jgi:hypothetical protein
MRSPVNSSIAFADAEAYTFQPKFQEGLYECHLSSRLNSEAIDEVKKVVKVIQRSKRSLSISGRDTL